MAAGTCLIDHLRTIIDAIVAVKKSLPSEVRIDTLQHDHVTDKSDGHFIMTVYSVPCYVDTAVTDGTPKYKMLTGGADIEIVVASSSGDAEF